MKTQARFVVTKAVRLSGKGGLGYRLLPLTDPPPALDGTPGDTTNADVTATLYQEPGSSRVFPATTRGLTVGKFRPGMVVEVESEGESWYPGTVKLLGWWPDADAIATWSALADGMERQILADWTIRKDAARNLHLERLEPLRKAYREAIGGHRTQILAQIVEFITH